MSAIRSNNGNRIYLFIYFMILKHKIDANNFKTYADNKKI